MPRKTPVNLAVVGADPAATGLQPPLPLRPPGMALWRAVTDNYEFADPASLHVLVLACQALDRAENCRALIDRDGEIIEDMRTGSVRSHPLIRDETQSRALSARLLGLLGLDLEPVRGRPGRPPGYSPKLGGR